VGPEWAAPRPAHTAILMIRPVALYGHVFGILLASCDCEPSAFGQESAEQMAGGP
jgi:hypothetical protein